MGIEINWFTPAGLWLPDSDSLLLYRRTLAGQKPFGFLMNTNFSLLTLTYTEKYFQHCMHWAFYPSMFRSVVYVCLCVSASRKNSNNDTNLQFLLSCSRSTRTLPKPHTPQQHVKKPAAFVLSGVCCVANSFEVLMQPQTRTGNNPHCTMLHGNFRWGEC